MKRLLIVLLMIAPAAFADDEPYCWVDGKELNGDPIILCIIDGEYVRPR